MRLRTALSLASFFLICFTLAVWRSPAFALLHDKNAALEIQSISGKIVAVGEAEFTLDLGKERDSERLKFLMDSETRMEGKLAIGANATVEYRSDDGKNIATRVIVVAASGSRSH